MAQAARPARLSEDFDIYRALSELSSAIDVLHNYTAKSIDLTLIGVHHDLKPQNVLVHDSTFVLADFGLTKFKSADQTSKSLFKVGGGHYLAPECEDYEEGFKKNAVSRPSDIWSFGCILAEMATYMFHGADGVTAFRAARKVKIAGFTTYTFHAGLNTPNPGVVEWLDKLEKNFQEIRIVDLIKEMLEVNPSLRPHSYDVTITLRFFAVKAYARHLQTQFDTLSVKYVSHELEAQQRLFEAWYETLSQWAALWAEDNAEFNVDKDEFESVLDTASQAMIGRLEEIRKEMELIALRYRKATSPLFQNLRHLNEELIELLPTKLRRQTYSHFELWMMQQVNATLNIEHQDLGNSNSTHSRKLTMLATMRRMNRMTLESSNNQKLVYHLASNAVQIMKRFEDHMLGVLRESPGAPAQLVLVEQVHYDTYWEGAVSEEMLTRMAAIAELLRKLSKPGNLPILPCQGFYHMPERFSFGFVFECPPAYYFSGCASGAASTHVYSLADIIDKTRLTQNRPSLDDRFYLAQLLASTLLDFHKAGWLHKSISSYNVISFSTMGSSAAELLRRPYLIGFNRSRQDLATAFTEGPNAADKSLEYMHPRYIEDKCRFRRGFDYYSLGLVLLEIGLWHSLSVMLFRLDIFPPKMSEKVLKEFLIKFVPTLNHTMGVDYCGAVHECLSWDTTVDDAAMTEEERAGLLFKFERLVVEQIRRCSLSDNLRDCQPPLSSVEDNRPMRNFPRSSATAPGASQTSSLPEKSVQPQKEALENDPQSRPEANASLDALDLQSESPDLSTPKARLELVKPDRSGCAGPVSSSDTLALEPEPSGLDTPRPSKLSLALEPEPSGLDTPRPSKLSVDFSPSDAQLRDAEAFMEYSERHHLGPPGFDHPLTASTEGRPRPTGIWLDVFPEQPDEEIDAENPLGIFDRPEHPIRGSDHVSMRD